MAGSGEQNPGATGIDRLAGSPETPVTPNQAPPPFTQAAPETFVPSEEPRLRHEADALQQERMAALLHHLAGFRDGPEDPDWVADAYVALQQIPGTALRPLAEMIAHGAEVRARLDHFNAAQNSMNAALAEVIRERDALRWDAILNARVAAVSAARTRDPPASGGFGRHTQSLYGDTPGSGVSP
jgi:hypothetical protein